MYGKHAQQREVQILHPFVACGPMRPPHHSNGSIVVFDAFDINRLYGEGGCRSCWLWATGKIALAWRGVVRPGHSPMQRFALMCGPVLVAASSCTCRHVGSGDAAVRGGEQQPCRTWWQSKSDWTAPVLDCAFGACWSHSLSDFPGHLLPSP